MAAMRKSTGLGLAVFVAGLTLVGPQVGVAVADPGGTDGSSAATHGSRENASDVESASAGPDISRAATVDAGPASSDPDAPVPANSEDPFTDPPVSLPDLDPSGSASDTTDAPGEPALAESVVDQPAPADSQPMKLPRSRPTAAARFPYWSATRRRYRSVSRQRWPRSSATSRRTRCRRGLRR